MPVRKKSATVRAVAASFVLASMALVSQAQAVVITGYDITNAEPSGFGAWSYNYSGTVTANGGLVNLTGGGGTLNDGVIPTTEQNNQLFRISDGTTITLYLDGATQVSSITLFGYSGFGDGNAIPGTLTGWSMTIDGQTDAFTSTPTGPSCRNGLCNDVVSLVGSGLDTLQTSEIVLSNFQGGWNGFFNIGEITVSGTSVQSGNVPEPATLALLGMGIAGLGFSRRKI